MILNKNSNMLHGSKEFNFIYIYIFLAFFLHLISVFFSIGFYRVSTHVQQIHCGFIGGDDTNRNIASLFWEVIIIADDWSTVAFFLDLFYDLRVAFKECLPLFLGCGLAP